ncbi:peptidylprolyl isomerase [Myxococcota bacterium]|nr:peptidylprolyl isomerase [Myxococcota bacterium]
MFQLSKRTLLLSLAFTLGTAASAHAQKPGDAKPADAKAPAKATATKNPVVVIKTSLGTIKAELFADKAPTSVENFLKYTDDKYYDGTIFHRVIKGFMIQGGGFDAQLTKKETREPIKNEAANGLKNEIGTLAMARTAIPDSATSQFYINTVNNPALDFKDPSARGIGYAVFGKVVEGMEVVHKISAVQTGPQNGMGDVPVKPVVIESVRREK